MKLDSKGLGLSRYALTAVAVVLVVCAALPAHAKVSKELKEEALAEVRKGLESNDPLEKRYAVMSGIQLRDKALDKELYAYLTVTNPAIRRGAVIAYASRGDKKGLAALDKELADAKDGRFRTMTQLLPALPDAVRVKLLKGWVTGKKVDPSLRADAFKYCAEWGTDAEYALLGGVVSAKDREPYLKVLRRTTRPAAVAWADKMLGNKKDAGARRAGLELALKLGGPEVDAVARKAVVDSDADIAELAYGHLVRVGDPAAALHLIKKLSSTPASAGLKEVVAKVLELRPLVPRAVADKLIADDAGDDMELTLMLHGVLGLTGDKEALETLVKLEDSTVLDERRKGVAGLGYTKSAKAAEILTGTLFDGHEDIRIASAVGLGVLGEGGGVKHLKQALDRKPDKEMTYRLLRSLGQIKTPDAASALMFKAGDPDPEVKRLVLAGLTNIGDKRTANILEVFTRDKDTELRFKATLLLLQLDKAKGERYITSAFQRPPEDYFDQIRALPLPLRDELIFYLLKSDSSQHRSDALDGLSLMGEKGIDILRRCTVDSFPADVREAAVATLLRHSSDKDVAFFQRMSQDGSDTDKILAIGWLTRKASPSLSGFFRTLMNGSKGQGARRMAALYALLRSES